jgi:NTP pyrophosphatase (non-canonical NTP hydrolase)
MEVILKHERLEDYYGGYDEGWTKEFDPIVMKLVEQAIGRQCYNGKNIRGKQVTELTIEELSEAIADVVLRVLLYAGWRDILNIKSAVTDAVQAIHNPVQSDNSLPKTSAESHAKTHD